MKTKKEIYASYGIEYNNKTGKILTPYGWCRPLLVNGNAKIGKGCYHFSTLPTNQLFDVVVNGKSYTVKGTCRCYCKGCYAMAGNYRYQSVKNALGYRTLIIREYIDFAYRAIMAQIEADKISTVRIHAAGDFDSLAYLTMWIRIIHNNPAVTFWTYTKVQEFESAFDHFANANIVKSIIPGVGLNFGHCDYVMDTYNKLSSAGKSVHICRCGVDKNQHCTNCKGCSVNEYVLFIEHSTEYKAEKDPNFAACAAMIDSQENKASVA